MSGSHNVETECMDTLMKSYITPAIIVSDQKDVQLQEIRYEDYPLLQGNTIYRHAHHNGGVVRNFR
jgi:hypothetical protein